MRYRGKCMVWIALVAGGLCLALALHCDLVFADAVALMGICFVCELVDSGLGMGYGTILTPVMLMMGYAPSDIVPTVLLSELLSGFSAAFFHHEIRNVELNFRGRDFRPASLLAAGSMVGVTAGVLLALRLPEAGLRMLIGCVIFLSGFFVLLVSRRVVEYRHWKMLLLSGVASFNKAVSGGGYGPLVTSGQILSGVRGKSAVGITSFAEGFTCLLAVSLFLLRGGYINPLVLVPMLSGALLSVPFSVFAISRSREDYLKYVIGLLTMGMGAFTIYKVLA